MPQGITIWRGPHDTAYTRRSVRYAQHSIHTTPQSLEEEQKTNSLAAEGGTILT